MDREYFYRMGSYDTEMKIWGGENIEMSLRVIALFCGYVLGPFSAHCIPFLIMDD